MLQSFLHAHRMADGSTPGLSSRSSNRSASSSRSDVPSDILLGDQVGRGTYGQVFAASFLGRPAAVKAVPVELNADGRSLCSELQREIKMLKTCDSAWIVRYFGCLQKASTLWIAMELCDGSVADVVRVTRAPLLEDEIAVVAAAVVRGLVHLHDERSIMHRDIKAGNILLSGADGGVKLCDLGVSAIPSCRSFRLPLVCTNSADHLHFLLPAPFLHSIQVCRPRSPITRSARR